MKKLLTSLFLAGFLPAANYADDLADIAALNPKFSTAEKEFVLGEAGKMRAAGLDPKPLYNKLREGLAKGAGTDALRKAVARERELYTEAARLLAPVAPGGNPTRSEIAQSVVIAVKRGAKTADIAIAVKENKDNATTLVAVVDMLGDFARFGISGNKAIRAASENLGRKGALSPTVAPENRADANRSILQREIRQDLPALKPSLPPTERPAEPGNPTGTQGSHDRNK